MKLKWLCVAEYAFRLFSLDQYKKNNTTSCVVAGQEVRGGAHESYTKFIENVKALHPVPMPRVTYATHERYSNIVPNGWARNPSLDVFVVKHLAFR